jgi:hypothetical protein
VEGGVKIHSGMRLASISDSKLEFRSAFGGRSYSFEGFDSVVLVYGSVPDTTLYNDLKSHLKRHLENELEKAPGDAVAATRLFLVGSAWVPRYLAEATQHGARVGMEI